MREREGGNEKRRVRGDREKQERESVEREGKKGECKREPKRENARA